METEVKLFSKQIKQEINMNTTERNNQIKTLKSLIAQAVETHKSTKKLARMSSNAENYSYRESSSAQWTYQNESENLFVAYTAYYMLRHGIEGEEEVNAYIESVLSKLRPENRERYSWACGTTIVKLENRKHGDYSRSTLKGAVECLIDGLNEYITKSEEKNEEK